MIRIRRSIAQLARNMPEEQAIRELLRALIRTVHNLDDPIAAKVVMDHLQKAMDDVNHIK